MAVATKRLLADTLIELLAKRPLDKITVKELVATCHVNRQTFYYNFQDIYDLIAWIFAEKTKEILDGGKIYENWQDSFREIVRSMLENKSLILNSFRSLHRTHMERYLKDWIRPIIERRIDLQSKGVILLPEDRSFIINIYTLGFIGLLMEWVENDMTEEYPSQIDQFIKLVDGSMEITIRKFAK